MGEISAGASAPFRDRLVAAIRGRVVGPVVPGFAESWADALIMDGVVADPLVLAEVQAELDARDDEWDDREQEQFRRWRSEHLRALCAERALAEIAGFAEHTDAVRDAIRDSLSHHGVDLNRSRALAEKYVSDRPLTDADVEAGQRVAEHLGLLADEEPQP